MGYLGYKPADKPLTSADITDGIIVNADIANSTINLTTKVTGTLPVTNGGTGLATLGTAAQELRVNSGATALEYYTPTVASSDYVLLATTDITSATASASFDGYFTSTYRNYMVIGSTLIPATDGESFVLRYRRSNADVTASSYRHTIAGSYYNTTDGNGVFVNGARVRSNMLITNSGVDNSATTGGVNFNLMIYNPLNASGYKYCTWQNAYIEDSATQWFSNNGTGLLVDSTAALSGLTFYFTAGNITSGNIKLYGIK
jgi:hypothetical protein